MWETIKKGFKGAFARNPLISGHWLYIGLALLAFIFLDQALGLILGFCFILIASTYRVGELVVGGVKIELLKTQIRTLEKEVEEDE